MESSPALAHVIRSELMYLHPCLDLRIAQCISNRRKEQTVALVRVLVSHPDEDELARESPLERATERTSRPRDGGASMITGAIWEALEGVGGCFAAEPTVLAGVEEWNSHGIHHALHHNLAKDPEVARIMPTFKKRVANTMRIQQENMARGRLTAFEANPRDPSPSRSRPKSAHSRRSNSPARPRIGSG